MYNITSGQWTWLGGSNIGYAFGFPGVYGTKGVSSPNNYPGSRYEHAMVLDSLQNKLYIFGGKGYSAVESWRKQ